MRFWIRKSFKFVQDFMDSGHRLIQQINVEFGLEFAKAFVFEAIYTFLERPFWP